MQERSIESLIIAALAQRKAGHQYAICPHRGRGNEGLKVEGLDIRIIPKISGNSDERGSSWQTPSSGAVIWPPENGRHEAVSGGSPELPGVVVRRVVAQRRV